MTDNFDSTYLRTPQTNQSEINHTADTIFLNDTSNYNNMKKIVPKIKKFIFVGTGEQVVLNSITDSSWVAEYLLSRSRNFDSSFCSIVNLRFEPIDYQSFNDSAFGDFYTRRWLYLKQSFQKHAKLLGLNINFNKIYINTVSTTRYYNNSRYNQISKVTYFGFEQIRAKRCCVKIAPPNDRFNSILRQFYCQRACQPYE